ncbi:MAG: CopD family protein [Rhodomicrobium sp.]
MAIWMAIHVLGVIVWVGGMFFAHMVLRPSAGPLDGATRLPLWHRAFSRFFPWVWLCIAAILVSGLAMVFLEFGGFAGAGAYIHAMTGLGIVMMLIYNYIYFMPWQRFHLAVLAADWPAADIAIGQMRRAVRINLVLGLVTAIVGASGRFLG